jgi:hypothetical protein
MRTISWMMKRIMSSRTMRCNGSMPRGRALGRAESIHGERVSHFERGIHLTPEEAVHTTHGNRQEPCQCL